MTSHADRPEFVYVTYIATTPERLWTALTAGEFTEQYWGGRRVESDWRPGSKVEYRHDGGRTLDILGEVLAADPPRLLQYTFQSGLGRGEPEPPSRVTFEIEQVGAMVRLTLTHDRFAPGSPALARVSKGWPGILSNLKTLLETGRPLIMQWNEGESNRPQA